MLIKRSLLLYFRDRQNIIFSLSAVFVMIGMYIFFLSSAQEAFLRNVFGLDPSIDIGSVMTSVVFAGMIASTSVTSGMIGLFIFFADKTRAAKDFLTTPVSRQKLMLSYVVASAIIGFVMTIALMLVCLLYLALNGHMISPQNFALLILTAVLTGLCANSLIFLISTIAKTENAFGSLCSVVATVIGFMMGVYIPLGNFPEAVQWVLRMFPLSHAASMFRQILADDALYAIFANSTASSQELLEFRLFFGIVFQYGDYISTFWFSAMVMVVTTVVLYGIALMVASKGKFSVM